MSERCSSIRSPFFGVNTFFEPVPSRLGRTIFWPGAFAHIVIPIFTRLLISSTTLTNNALQLVYLDEMEIPTAREFFCCFPRYFQSNLSVRPGHFLANSIYS